jgi:hypothetical protein
MKVVQRQLNRTAIKPREHGKLINIALAVTSPPHRRRNRIQRMRTTTSRVIHQQLVADRVDNKTLLASQRSACHNPTPSIP